MSLQVKRKSIFFMSYCNIGINNKDLFQSIVWFSGSLGTKKYIIPNEINVRYTREFITLSTSKEYFFRFCVLFSILFKNTIYGLSREFSVYMVIKGLGFKMSVLGNQLLLKVGYSHTISYSIPKNITFWLLPKKAKAIRISGSDYQFVREVNARLRHFKKPNSYKIQGIFNFRDKPRLKDGKKKSR